MMAVMRDLVGDSFVMIDNDAMLKPPKREAGTLHGQGVLLPLRCRVRRRVLGLLAG
jgi:hypothetical protein